MIGIIAAMQLELENIKKEIENMVDLKKKM